jgi:hypothetical protein
MSAVTGRACLVCFFFIDLYTVCQIVAAFVLFIFSLSTAWKTEAQMDEIKMDLKQLDWEGVDWIHLAQDRDQWWLL